ncbi:MAG: TonB-dependent receptor [Pseudomonadota bacterium]
MSYKFSPGALAALVTLGSPLLAAGQTAPAADSQLETVIVTASPLSADPDYLATLVDKVSRDEILRSGGANLADVLGQVPGVTGTSFASGASRPVIRGFDANRVRTLENGIGSFDVSDVGPDHGVPIDPLSAQQVEVVRGAGTLRYGSQAIGGVVNAINNRVPQRLPSQPLVGELSGSLASNADSRQGSGQFDSGLGQFALHGDAFIRHTEDYDIPGGQQSNSWFRGDGYALGSSYFFGPDNGADRIGLGVVHYDAKYGIPGKDSYIDMQQTKEMLRSSFALDRGPLQTVTVEGGYADYQHSERDPAGEPLSTFKDREWDSRVEGTLSAVGPFSGLAVGVQLQRRNFSALGEGADYLQPTTTRSVAAFGFAEVPLAGRLRLQLGARIESVDVDGTPATDLAIARTFTPTSASAGLVFDATPAVRLGATLTSAARAPAQTELFARGPHDGPATFETGDPALGVERANSLEGTIRVRRDRVRFEGSLWGAQFNHFIYGRLTGRTCNEESLCIDGDSLDLKELKYTQLGAKFWGAEGKSTISLTESAAGSLQAILLGDFVRARLDGNAGNVPRIPPWHLGAGLAWDSGALDGSVFLKYAGRQTETAFAETPTAGFASLDAQLAWRPRLANPALELVLIGRNLTDSTQRNAVAINKDAVIMPGRDLRLVFRATF